MQSIFELNLCFFFSRLRHLLFYLLRHRIVFCLFVCDSSSRVKHVFEWRECCVQLWDYHVKHILNKAVYIVILDWVQIVDVAGDVPSTVVLHVQFTREKLKLPTVRPGGDIGLRSDSPCHVLSGDSGVFGNRYNIALTSMTECLIHPYELVLQDMRSTIYEAAEGDGNQVFLRVVGSGVEKAQLRGRFLEAFDPLYELKAHFFGDIDIGLGNVPVVQTNSTSVFIDYGLELEFIDHPICHVWGHIRLLLHCFLFPSVCYTSLEDLFQLVQNARSKPGSLFRSLLACLYQSGISVIPSMTFNIFNSRSVWMG